MRIVNDEKPPCVALELLGVQPESKGEGGGRPDQQYFGVPVDIIAVVLASGAAVNPGAEWNVAFGACEHHEHQLSSVVRVHRRDAGHRCSGQLLMLAWHSQHREHHWLFVIPSRRPPPHHEHHWES